MTKMVFESVREGQDQVERSLEITLGGAIDNTVSESAKRYASLGDNRRPESSTFVPAIT